MYINVTFSVFCDEFRRAGREDQFSYEGKRALFELLEDEDIELDVIALCCDYSEDDAETIAQSYSIAADDDQDIEDAVREYLEENAPWFEELPSGAFIYENF